MKYHIVTSKCFTFIYVIVISKRINKTLLIETPVGFCILVAVNSFYWVGFYCVESVVYSPITNTYILHANFTNLLIIVTLVLPTITSDNCLTVAGMMSATATLGVVLLWDVDGGLTQIDKYLYSTEDWIKAGALLACGIVNSGVKNECDPALALLSDYTSHQTTMIRIGSIVG